MAGPWEKYAHKPEQSGPWAKYGAAPSDPGAPQTSLVDDIKQGVGNLVAGGIRGAGSIGATLLYPIDKATDLIKGDRGPNVTGLVTGKQPLSRNEERRQQMDEGLRTLGADTNSLAFKGGKLAAEIAGTAGAGGAVANVARRVVPAAAQATPVVANLLRSIETAGAQGGGLLSRSAGGAVSGAATAGLVDPNEAGTGALIGGAAPGVMQIMGKAGSYVGSKLRGGAADPQKLAAARAAQEAGYVIPPSDIQQQGAVTELMGGLSGKIKTAQEASARNASVTTRLAKAELGIPEDTPLTREVLASVRKKAGDAYEAVRGAGTVKATPEYIAAIDKIGQEAQGAARSFPGLKRNDVAELVDTLKQPQFDSGDAIDAIRVLRDQADSLYIKGEKGAAKAYKAASGALEQALDSHLQSVGNPEALGAFRQARQTIAKTYTVEKALNSGTGEVSAQVLAQQLKKGKPLSGGLRTAADVGEAFPKATQALKESPKAVSPLDWAVGAMSGTSTGNPLMLASVLARPVTRNALLSKPMQAYAARDIGPSALTSALTPQNQLLLQRSLPVLAADR